MTPDTCPPSECVALWQRVAELEHAAQEAKAAQERFSALDTRHRAGTPSEDLKWEWARAMALAEVDTDTFQERATPELILELIARVAELEGEVWEARAKAFEEAAKLCEQHSRFYELHPEAAAIDPVEFQGAYSTGALKCAQIIREHQAEAGKEARE
jgi:hypothetical protein